MTKASDSNVASNNVQTAAEFLGIIRAAAANSNSDQAWNDILIEFGKNCLDMGIEIELAAIDCLQGIFDATIRVLLDRDLIKWDGGRAEKFVLSCIAGLATALNTDAVATDRRITATELEDMVKVLVLDWERVCPLPEIPGQVEITVEQGEGDSKLRRKCLSLRRLLKMTE